MNVQSIRYGWVEGNRECQGDGDELRGNLNSVEIKVLESIYF